MQLNKYGWDHGWAAALAGLDDQTLAPARVLAVHRGLLAVQFEAGEELIPVAGALQSRARAATDLPTVGDWVGARPGGAIEALLPRRTLLQRADESASGEPLAANAELCVIATALDHDLNLRRLERFVAMASAGGLVPLVACTKADKSADPVAEAAAVGEQVGAEALPLSSLDGWGVEALKARMLPEHTTALLGMSGVGKSTLVNLLLGEERQKTLPTRETDDRGRHATTHRELFILPGGALVIDMPGMRLPRMASEDGLAPTFADVAALAEQCRFADCGHDGEPGCAVEAAIDAGELDPGRLAAMRKLEREGRSARERHERQRDYQRRHPKTVRARTRLR